MAEFVVGLGAGAFVGWMATHLSLRTPSRQRSSTFADIPVSYPEAVDTELGGPARDAAA